MSYTDPQPRFSLVRTDLMGASESLITGSPGSTRHDELVLVDPVGRPCALPIQQGFVSLDHRREYVDGTLGQTNRLLRHQMTLAIDYLDSSTRRRLERWMFDRAPVQFSPGYGHHTDLAWRPCQTPVTQDLTGTWAISNQMDGNTALVWDALFDRMGLMRNFLGTTGCIVKTPFGAGQVFKPSGTNLFYSATNPPGSYPVGDTNALSGWELWGTWSTDLTRTFIAAGFGPTYCPGALRVVTNVRRTGNGTDGRSLGRVIPSSVSGAGAVWVSVWLRGRTGSGSSLSIGWGAERKTLDLSTKDLSEWTCCSVGLYSTAWPGTSAQDCQIVLTPATGVTDDCDLLVGPVECMWQAGSAALGDGYPQWNSYTRASGDALRVPNYVLPRTGTMFFSVYVPPFVAYDSNCPIMFPLFVFTGTDSFRLFLRTRAADHPYASLLCYYGAGATDYLGGSGGITVPQIEAASLLSPGRVSTVAVTWDNAQMKAYINGVLRSTRPGAVNPPTVPTEAWLWSSRGNQAAWPMVPLGCRIDHVCMSANEVADAHATASTTAALEAILPTRGRTYQIRAIPSTPRGVSGEAQWTGQLVLEQTIYSSAAADITSKEG